LPHHGPAPQPEGYGDFTRHHVFAQLPAKLHQPNATLPPGLKAAVGQASSSAGGCQAVRPVRLGARGSWWIARSAADPYVRLDEPLRALMRPTQPRGWRNLAKRALAGRARTLFCRVNVTERTIYHR